MRSLTLKNLFVVIFILLLVFILGCGDAPGTEYLGPEDFYGRLRVTYKRGLDPLLQPRDNETTYVIVRLSCREKSIRLEISDGSLEYIGNDTFVGFIEGPIPCNCTHKSFAWDSTLYDPSAGTTQCSGFTGNGILIEPVDPVPNLNISFEIHNWNGCGNIGNSTYNTFRFTWVGLSIRR
jgi:hypothetical protein